MAVAATDTHGSIEAVFRIEAAKLIGGLTRLVRDVGLAEELAQDALVAALEQWPQRGIPENPGAWLMTTAKRRAIDSLRRRERALRKHRELARGVPQRERELAADIEVAAEDDLGDDVLRLIFVACHPVLKTEARVALTLRVVGGLTTAEIARAFLVPEKTIAQRIVRAKKALAKAQVPFEVPKGTSLAPRLASVLEVIYLIFNEGYSPTAGENWLRPALCEEALRLGRILAELEPGEAETHGLVALMEIQASRARARVGSGGEPILLADQDRGRWDRVLIGRGLAALERAEALGDIGNYTLQAAIAACHARAPSLADTDWRQIVGLYDVLAAMAPSPVVQLNRAVAIGMASGPAAGLEALDTLASDPAIATYHLLPSVRGDLLRRLGRMAEAHREFIRAAELTHNARERALLVARASACKDGLEPLSG